MGKPTECVRAMLDERGIEYRHQDGTYCSTTTWQSMFGEVMFAEREGLPDTLVLPQFIEGVTPEQAIAATVGNARIRGIATREQEAIVCDFLRKINPDRDWAYLGEVEHAWISSMVNAIAATVGGEANVRGD